MGTQILKRQSSKLWGLPGRAEATRKSPDERGGLKYALKGREISLVEAQGHGLLPVLSIFLFQFFPFFLDFFLPLLWTPDSLSQE